MNKVVLLSKCNENLSLFGAFNFCENIQVQLVNLTRLLCLFLLSIGEEMMDKMFLINCCDLCRRCVSCLNARGSLICPGSQIDFSPHQHCMFFHVALVMGRSWMIRSFWTNLLYASFICACAHLQWYKITNYRYSRVSVES